MSAMQAGIADDLDGAANTRCSSVRNRFETVLRQS